jgi:hypothetical protein
MGRFYETITEKCTGVAGSEKHRALCELCARKEVHAGSAALPRSGEIKDRYSADRSNLIFYLIFTDTFFIFFRVVKQVRNLLLRYKLAGGMHE